MLQTNLQSEFATPLRRGRRKRSKSYVLAFVLSSELYSGQLREVNIRKESNAAELHTLQNLRTCWKVVPYPMVGRQNFLRCHFVFKVKIKLV